MDFRQAVVSALMVSVFATVFGFGLKARIGDIVYVLRRPGLLARSFVAVFVVMPLFALALVELFDFRQVVEIGIIALAISPLPPLLPKRNLSAGGHASYSLGLMVILAVVALVAMPALLAILQWLSGRPLILPTATIARVMLQSAIAPLAIGMVIRARAPSIADRLHKPVRIIGSVLLPAACLLVLAGAAPLMWALVGQGTLAALTLFVLGGLAIGHALGGPEPDHAVVLALSTACRHPGIAFVVAATNFPGQPFGAFILLYALVTIVAAVPYVLWRRRVAARHQALALAVSAPS